MISAFYRGLTFNVLQTLGWEREPMLDRSNTTYECTRIRGSMVLAYGPGATSYAAGNPPTARAGFMPPQTDAAIRTFLEQPRGQLTVLALDPTGAKVTVLSSPPTNAPCDCRNGPFTKVHSIQHVHGERLWKIHWEFETYINETPNPFTLVSNRWSCHADVNWQHLTTRVYQGVCTVRGDRLRNTIVTGPTASDIDNFRAVFAGFSVPLGFQRTNVKVTVTPDGNSALYEVVDTEKLFNQPSDSPAVRLEYADSNWVWNGSWGRTVAQFMSSQARLIGSNAGVIMPNTMVDIGRATLMNGTAALAANMPKRYKACVVRAWGNQITPRTDLTKLAMSVALGRLGQAAVIDTTASEILVTGDTNNFVQVSYTISWDYQTVLQIPTVGLVLAGIQVSVPGSIGGPGDNEWNAAIVEDPNTPMIFQDRLSQNPPFPGDSGTRGTWLGQLVTQTLESFNTAPAAVP